MMGDKAPEWLQTGNARRTTPTPKTGPPAVRSRPRTFSPEGPKTAASDRPIARRAIRMWIPSLVLAAAASLVLYLSTAFWFPEPIAQPLVGDFHSSDKLEADADETNAAATDLLAQRPDQGDSAIASSSAPVSENTSVTSLEIDRKPVADSSMAVATEQPNTKTPAGVTPEPAEFASANASKNDWPESIQNKLSSRGIADPVFTLVAEITVDPVAQQRDELRTLLEKYEIVFADDLNLDQEQLDALVASRMIGPVSKGDDANSDSDVSIMFVRARATRIFSFLTDLESQYVDFPSYRYDMAAHPNVAILASQLGRLTTNNDAARRLTFRDNQELGLVSSFPIGDRAQEYMSLENRKRAAKTDVPGDWIDSISYLILLVRNLQE